MLQLVSKWENLLDHLHSQQSVVNVVQNLFLAIVPQKEQCFHITEVATAIYFSLFFFVTEETLSKGNVMNTNCKNGLMFVKTYFFGNLSPQISIDGGFIFISKKKKFWRKLEQTVPIDLQDEKNPPILILQFKSANIKFAPLVGCSLNKQIIEV